MTTPSNNPVDTRVAVVEREVNGMYAIFGRIEQSIEKITETNSSIKEMLAVHEQRLQQQENGTRTFYEIIEKRKEEYDRGLERVHRQLESVVGDLRRQIKEEIKEQYTEMKSTVDDLRRAQNDFTDRVEQKIQTLQTSADSDFSSLEARVRKLEAWRWIIAGGGFVGGFVLGNFDVLSKLFGH